MINVRRQFQQQHPATQGHFPQRPIMPGAFVLDEAIRAVAAQWRLSPQHLVVAAVKFPNSVLPGQSMHLEIEDAVVKGHGTRVNFRGTVEGKVVITGSVQFCAT